MFLNTKSPVQLIKHTIKSFKHEEVNNNKLQGFEFQEFSEFSESQNHIMQKLPSNCFEEIFESMDNDRNSLFSCALVNRHWCRLSIPLLWRRPFEHGYPKDFGLKLIKIYINFLPVEERELLRAQDILSSNNNNNSSSSNNNSNKLLLLFEYPKYIQYFDINNFIYAIKLWVIKNNKSNKPYDPNKFEQKIHLLARLLGNLFCKYSNGFKLINYQNNHDIKFTDITSYNGIESVLHKLNEFKYQSFNIIDEYCLSWNNLFNNLSEYTYNIQYLSIHIYKNNRYEYSEIDDSIIKLIQSQKNLKSLSLSNFWRNSSIFYSAIGDHCNSLTYLRLEGLSDVILLIKLLNTCRNLITLDLIQSTKGDDYEHNLNLTTLSVTDFNLSVKNFYYNFNDTNVGTLIYFLKLIGRNLFTFSSTLYTIPLPVLVTLKNHNSYITHLSLKISHDLLQVFSNLLKNLSLKYLFLNTSKYHKLSLHHIIQLAESLPTSLLYLDLNFMITSKEFESLLLNSNSNFITIAFHNIFENHKDYLKIMVDHVINNSGSLREIRFQKDFFNRDCNNFVNFQKWLDDELKFVIDNYNNDDVDDNIIINNDILKELKVSEIKSYNTNFGSYWY
ncbi:hypothetical protein RclHR1_02370010 [Rhizophagus clarus]|uniref:F-box domain-containing protein n=1 Tax=Rhizophagus clarus TaxID=94130 RepID=A0A2Z6QWW5_9GLOM|nr:hypothetical protein RclHR1_02370010 [Rhizophagus clarus]